MILKLSLPRCVIPVSKESVQQKLIDELWFRKQLSTFVYLGPINSWALGSRPDCPPPPPPPTLSGPDHTYTWPFTFPAWYKWNLWNKVTSTYKRHVNDISINIELSKGWRYQRGNQKPSIKEEKTIQWLKRSRTRIISQGCIRVFIIHGLINEHSIWYYSDKML